MTPAWPRCPAAIPAADGAVLSEQAFVLRFSGVAGDRLLVVNLGIEHDYTPCPEPLLVAPEGCLWTVQWSSEAPEYGGAGIVNPCRSDGWHLGALCAVLLAPAKWRNDARG